MPPPPPSIQMGTAESGGGAGVNHGDAFSMAREGRLYWWAPMPNDVPEIAMIMADEHVSRYRTDPKNAYYYSLFDRDV